ncbi:MAG TPA: MAPEG family protein [Pseudolabrys sp.]|nr:MAPEG family protein [Pseudolabrys sp.]
MSIQFVLLPLFVEVALTLGLLVWLFLLRRHDLVSRTVHPSKIALREPNWPQRTQQIANSFSNQFELPVLFYVLTILAIVTHHADIVFIVLAWIFVIGRLGQAYVHTTSNRVMLRGSWYGISALALIVMWIIFAVRIFADLP